MTKTKHSHHILFILGMIWIVAIAILLGSLLKPQRLLTYKINDWKPAIGQRNKHFVFDSIEDNKNATTWNFSPSPESVPTAPHGDFSIIHFKSNPAPYDIAAESLVELQQSPDATLAGARSESAVFAIQKTKAREVSVWKFDKVNGETWANTRTFRFKSTEDAYAFISKNLPDVLNLLDKQKLLTVPKDLILEKGI
jgi:hypothetical protein